MPKRNYEFKDYCIKECIKVIGFKKGVYQVLCLHCNEKVFTLSLDELNEIKDKNNDPYNYHVYPSCLECKEVALLKFKEDMERIYNYLYGEPYVYQGGLPG